MLHKNIWWTNNLLLGMTNKRPQNIYVGKFYLPIYSEYNKGVVTDTDGAHIVPFYWLHSTNVHLIDSVGQAWVLGPRIGQWTKQTNKQTKPFALMGLPFTYPFLPFWPGPLDHIPGPLPFKPYILQANLPSFMTFCQIGGQYYEFEKVLITAKADPSGPQKLPANIFALLNSY